MSVGQCPHRHNFLRLTVFGLKNTSTLRPNVNGSDVPHNQGSNLGTSSWNNRGGFSAR